MAALIGISEEVKGKSIPVGLDPITIGRAEDNTLALDNPTVSSRHCSLTREGRRFTLRDLGSTNGTRVNSRDIQEARLKPKDIIQVGSVEFLFDAHADEVEIEDTQKISDAPAPYVEEEKGPSGAPESFESISPFGARKDDAKGPWFLLIAILFVVALAVVVYFFFRLLTAS